MVHADKDQLPFLVVGGGIGGLAAAYALALKGFPVRLLEQAGEFREVGAGIQLGPNVFRALARLGLRDAVLADAWRPGAQEMRCALSGKVITRIPFEDEFFERFTEPYGVTHRHDLHATLLNACRSHPLITLDVWQRAVDFAEEPDVVEVALENVQTNGRTSTKGRALIGCDGLWSKIREQIVGDGKPRVSGHIAYRAVLKREEVPEDLWQPDMVLYAGPRTHFVQYPLRRGELYNLVAVFHSDHYVEGWNTEGDNQLLYSHFKGQQPQVMRMLERIETWRYVGPVRPRAGEELVEGPRHASGRCRASDAAISRAGRLPGDRRRRRGSPRKSPRQPDDLPAAFLAYEQQRYLRTARVQIMARVYGEFFHARGPTAELRDQMLGARTADQAYDSINWLYGSI